MKITWVVIGWCFI